MARALWLRDVLEDLRQQGVPVHYVAGWETRGSTTFDPRGIICHDTGGSATSTDEGEIGTLLNGSTSAPAPIAQLYLSRTTGVHLVAAGRCNHALTGQAGPLKGFGNSNLIGIEAAANPGRAWPAAQYRWYVLLVAAICRRRGWTADRNIAAHREHQPGQKVDPQGISMPTFRADVARAITNPDTTTGDDVLEDSAAGRNTHDRVYALLTMADSGGGNENNALADILREIKTAVTAIKVDPTAFAAAVVKDTTFITTLAAAVAAQVTMQAGATAGQVEEIVGRVVDRELDEQSRGGADTD